MNNCNDNQYWEIIHIPDKPPFLPQQQPTVNVYAAVIDPKHANTLVRKLNQILPLGNLRHVKRVRKQPIDEGPPRLSVILCLASENDSQLDIIPPEVASLIDTYQLSTFIAKVCKYVALSKEEWEEQCKIWPTSYHPPTYNIRGITGFSEEESHSICTFMKLTLDLAKSNFQVVNAAIIIDPLTNQVIASACDQVHSCSGPINHKDDKATTSTSLANKNENHDNMILNSSAKETKRLCDGVSCLNPWRWSQNSCNDSSCSWHPLRHAGMVAIEHSAARDRHLFPATADDFAEMDQMQTSFTCPSSKKQKTDFTQVKDDEELNCHLNGVTRPYLCTGYDIYLIWEPCTMCAMALVHQRVKRIFYGFPNPIAGGLGSVHRLQGEKSLNHHYAVFNVLLPEEILYEGTTTVVSKKDDSDDKPTQIC